MLLDAPVGSPPRLLSYCTNVHPGESVAEITAALEAHARPLRQRLGGPFAIGLRLGETAVRELSEESSLDSFRAFLAREEFAVTTLNVFPQGEFHAEVVKDAVYRPDWSTPERLDYTRRAAGVLARLLPSGDPFGTLSTLPLGFRGPTSGKEASCARALVALAHDLAVLEEREGARIQVCLEPEPLCLLETTAELIAFHRDHLLARAEALPAVNGRSGAEQITTHVGACLDACHAAVEFEDPAASVDALERAGIAVGKIQISSALAAFDPAGRPDVLARLRDFAEPRFLHQVVARSPERTLSRFVDLPEFLAALDRGLRPEQARCHFHVPVHLADMPPLGTTRSALLDLLRQQRDHPSVRHLEVETYTFPVLPDPDAGAASLVRNLEQELRFARAHLLGEDPAAMDSPPIRPRP